MPFYAVQEALISLSSHTVFQLTWIPFSGVQTPGCPPDIKKHPSNIQPKDTNVGTPLYKLDSSFQQARKEQAIEEMLSLLR